MPAACGESLSNRSCNSGVSNDQINGRSRRSMGIVIAGGSRVESEYLGDFTARSELGAIVVDLDSLHHDAVLLEELCFLGFSEAYQLFSKPFTSHSFLGE